jgi:hypothetical protein
MSDSPNPNARFEELGPEAVRSLTQTNSWPSPERHLRAIQWLAEKDQESKRDSEVLKSEEIEIARSAKDAAWAAARAAERAAAAAERANKRATIALAIAAISIMVTAYSSWISHMDNVHPQSIGRQP